MAAGMAHILFPGGGMFLSAGTPYERQVLIEHILGHVRSKRILEVKADRRRWLVERADDQQGEVVCGRCKRKILDAVCRGQRDDTLYCVVCALK
jgi:hypothetical protein